MAAHGDGDQIVQVFERAINAFASMIERGLNRADAAEALTNLALAYGVELEPDEIEQQIAKAFAKVKINGKQPSVEEKQRQVKISSNEWNAGEDLGEITPRPWLMAYQFCRQYISSVVAAGGIGKTALRLLQYISLATGRSLSGQKIFKRSRVLLISLEEDDMELRRRIKAVMLHYNIQREELDGWLYCWAPKGLKLAVMKNRVRQYGDLETQLRDVIKRRKPELISLDPFVKTHALQENDSGDMDFVCDLLAQICIEENLAVDSPHHVHKGNIEPGNADAGRGSSGIRDAARLVSTLCAMSEDEAKRFDVPPEDRRYYIRLDPAKINIAAPPQKATWFKLVGVKIDNSTEEYPDGDQIQVAEPWKPPEIWADLTDEMVNSILDDIERGNSQGQRYSEANAAKERAAWKVVQWHLPKKTDAQCREIITAWIRNSLLFSDDFDDPVQRKSVKGLYVDHAKRPGDVIKVGIQTRGEDGFKVAPRRAHGGEQGKLV